MVIKLRILLDTEQNVFRDIEIEDSSTFEQLHYAILDSFEWDSSEMASFYASNDDWDKGEEIPLMDIQEDFGPKSLKTMQEVQLKDKIDRKGQKFIYVFDFFLMWCFYVDVLDIKTAEADIEYPILAMSYGQAPNPNSKQPVNFGGTDNASEPGSDDEEDTGFNFDDLIQN